MVGQSYAGATRVDNQSLWRITWTTAAAIGFAALLGWLVLGRILRPVRRLATATRRITTTQDLATPLPAAGSDEIGQLTHSFEHMLAALRRSRAQQQQLVQDAGHELRTPLTSVRGSAELFQQAHGRLDPKGEEQILTTLVTETAALDDLMRELVELATDRRTEEEPEAVDLAVAAEDSAQRCRLRTGGKADRLTGSCAPPPASWGRAVSSSHAAPINATRLPASTDIAGWPRATAVRGPWAHSVDDHLTSIDYIWQALSVPARSLYSCPRPRPTRRRTPRRSTTRSARSSPAAAAEL